MDVRIIKSKLRKEIQLLLQNIDKKIILDESKNVTSQILNDSTFKSSKTISIFVSTPTEIMTDELIKYSLENKKKVFIPYFEKNSKRMEMLFLPSMDIFNELPNNFYGIRQFTNEMIKKISSNYNGQSSDNLEINNISYTNNGPLDLVICPLVAASRDGSRLGHGKGYYDKFLQEHIKLFSKAPITYGVALNCQIKENNEIPMDKYDYKLDKIFYSC